MIFELMTDDRGKKNLLGCQLRAARALLGINANTLAQESEVSLRTIRRAEIEHGQLTISEPNIMALTAALEARGAVFDFSGNGGVSLRQRPRPRRGD